jgi:Phytanoyl-CoA dioxygenase (PhyH)/PHD-finger
MRDATDLYKAGNFKALRQKLDEDGFIWVRGMLPREDVLAARAMMLDCLDEKEAFAPGTKKEDAVISKDDRGRYIKGWTVDAESGGVVGDRDSDVVTWRDLGNSKTLTDVYNGKAHADFFGKLFGEQHQTQPGCTWLRMRGRGDLTAEHADYYYFKGNTDLFRGNRENPRCTSDEKHKGRGKSARQEFDCSECGSIATVAIGDAASGDAVRCTLCDKTVHMSCVHYPLKAPPMGEFHCRECTDQWFDVYTCWTPLGSLDIHNGVLAVAPGTHRCTGYDTPIRGRELPGSFKAIEKKVVWEATPVEPGDIILFNIKTVHGATKNTTNLFRLSLDTRVVAHPIPQVPPTGPEQFQLDAVDEQHTHVDEKQVFDSDATATGQESDIIRDTVQLTTSSGSQSAPVTPTKKRKWASPSNRLLASESSTPQRARRKDAAAAAAAAVFAIDSDAMPLHVDHHPDSPSQSQPLSQSTAAADFVRSARRRLQL